MPSGVFSHSEEKHDHDINKLSPKPEGMIEFGQDPPPAGSEYAVPPMDHGDHGMHGMDHSMPGDDPFRQRGTHDLSKLEKPKTKAQALLARGRNIYLHMCAFCHGEDGNGGGIATDYLYPWPRDFRKGIFKFRSTPTGTLVRDEDIYRTITLGVAGTAMPAWGDALSPEDTWALVNLIKSFSKRFRKEAPGQAIKIEPVASTPERIARGKELFFQNKCNDCHGDSGKGDGRLADSLIDAWRHAVFVHDITNPNHFKAGRQPEAIYRTISTGLDGTPMESYSHLPEQDRWALVHFIRSRFSKDFQKAEFETDIYSKYVSFELDTDPYSPVWKDVASTNLVLRPLSARRDAVEVINFASVNNGEVIAIRLKWKDATKDGFVENRSDVYTDGAAVQLALGAVTLHTHGHNEPFFGMGNRGKPVNIWHWRAGLEETLEASEDSEYLGGVDMDALIFGGIMSNPVTRLLSTAQNSVDELNAEGFGTITPQLPEFQNVEGAGEWQDGEWTVVFLRTLESRGKWDAVLKIDTPVLVAFAVWDGVKDDRNGRKVITVWQRLNVQREPTTRQGQVAPGSLAGGEADG
ncbi:MAG: c-type cytochrome [Nitrospina sp.]|nr:MAG: c-type cytochrome [Nitrospina sp.]